MEQYKTIKTMQDGAKAMVNEALASVLEQLGAVPSGNGKHAIPFTAEMNGEEKEVWVELTLTAKNPSDRRNSQGGITPAFDPFEAEEAFQRDLAAKEAEKTLKAQATKAKAKKGKKETASEA